MAYSDTAAERLSMVLDLVVFDVNDGLFFYCGGMLKIVHATVVVVSSAVLFSKYLVSLRD